MKKLLSAVLVMALTIGLTACGKTELNNNPAPAPTVAVSAEPTVEPSVEPSSEPSAEPAYVSYAQKCAMNDGYTFESNGNGTHKVNHGGNHDADADFCVYDANGKCLYCSFDRGFKYPQSILDFYGCASDAEVDSLMAEILPKVKENYPDFWLDRLYDNPELCNSLIDINYGKDGIITNKDGAVEGPLATGEAGDYEGFYLPKDLSAEECAKKYYASLEKQAWELFFTLYSNGKMPSLPYVGGGETYFQYEKAANPDLYDGFPCAFFNADGEPTEYSEPVNNGLVDDLIPGFSTMMKWYKSTMNARSASVECLDDLNYFYEAAEGRAELYGILHMLGAYEDYATGRKQYLDAPMYVAYKDSDNELAKMDVRMFEY